MGELRFSINAKEAQNEIRSVTEQMQQLNSAMNEAAKSKDWASFTSMAAAMNNLESYRRNINNEARGLQSNLPMQNSVGNLFNNSTNIVNSVGNGISAAGSGSASGMVSSAVQGAGGVTKLLSALGLGATATGAILGGLALAGGVAVGIDKTSKVWEESMDGAVQNNTLYNRNRFNLSASQNSEYLRNRYNRLSDLRRGTQYTTDEAVELQNAIAKYGFTEENVDDATSAILYAQHNTGANRDTLSRLVGMQNLYGYNGAMAVQNAYQGLKDSGMTDARFDEFLDGVQKAMEEGISKGFVGSVEDIVNNVSLFSKLSGGATIWSGSAGADRVQKISSGFGSAVNLNSMNDMMMYGAAQGVVGTLTESDYNDLASKSYISVNMLKNDPSLTARLIMEQGSNGAFFTPMLKNYIQNVRSQYADMPEYELQTYMKSFGLNTTVAAQLQSLMNNWANSGYTSDISGSVQNIISSPANKSKETNYQDSMNNIHQAIVELGQKSFDIKSAAISSIDGNVEAIKNFLLKDDEQEAVNTAKTTASTLASSPEQAAKYDAIIESEARNYPISVPGSAESKTAIAVILSNGLKEKATNDDYLAIGKGFFTKGKDTYFDPVWQKDYLENKYINNILTEGVGDEQYDNEFIKLATKYIQWGSKANNKGTFNPTDMYTAVEEFSKNRDLTDAYDKKNTSQFMQGLEFMLKSLFGEIKITSRED